MVHLFLSRAKIYTWSILFFNQNYSFSDICSKKRVGSISRVYLLRKKLSYHPFTPKPRPLWKTSWRMTKSRLWTITSDPRGWSQSCTMRFWKGEQNLGTKTLRQELATIFPEQRRHLVAGKVTNEIFPWAFFGGRKNRHLPQWSINDQWCKWISHCFYYRVDRKMLTEKER